MPAPDPRLAVQAFGTTFPTPLGVAAGLDKNAVAFPALLALGFSFVEVGTVLPSPQAGNPKPRVFRLPKDLALINRMGFPSNGLDAVAASLQQRYRPRHLLGCNVGPNKTSVEAGTVATDCIAGLERIGPFGAYSVINVSSPNTARLRDLQGKAALRALLREITSAVPPHRSGPLLIKLSPDLTGPELHDVLDVVDEIGIDGVVATNTTLSRPPGLRSRAGSEGGGLSGRPLSPLASRMVRTIAQETNGKLAIIAAGGIFTGSDVLAAIAAGATLAQVYTGFIYRGPAMPQQVNAEMLDLMDRHGVRSLGELRGVGLVRFA